MYVVGGCPCSECKASEVTKKSKGKDAAVHQKLVLFCRQSNSYSHRKPLTFNSSFAATFWPTTTSPSKNALQHNREKEIKSVFLLAREQIRSSLKLSLFQTKKCSKRPAKYEVSVFTFQNYLLQKRANKIECIPSNEQTQEHIPNTLKKITHRHLTAPLQNH